MTLRDAQTHLIKATSRLPDHGPGGALRAALMTELRRPLVKLDANILCKIGRTLQHAIGVVALWTPMEADDMIVSAIDAVLDELGCPE